MNEFNKNLPYGATPIDRNEFEQKNILKAQIWLISCKKKDFLTDTFLLKLHKKMFDEVWKWAGKYRLSNQNIGGEWQNVPLELTYSPP
jgi:fido (protein-threonine AMPylation protein)